MLSHFRHAFRSLSRTPGFTFVAILTLALGIGISTSSFSTTNAFLLRSLPYPQSDDLVRVFRVTPQFDTGNHAPAVILHLQENLKTLEDVTPYYFDQTSISEPGQPPEQVNGICAGANIFNTLRVQPVLGRGFSAEDGQEGKDQGIVITDKMWHKRFAGDPEVIHRSVRINGEKLNIIGVLPASFEAPLIWANAEFIRPWVVHAAYRTQHKDTWLDCVGRLKPGVSLDQVNSEVATIAASLARDFPKEHATDGMRAVGFAASNMGGINSVLIWLITGLAMAVLLVACANLASLQLARAFGRTREFAIRSSLGASRLQLMAPLLAESLLLALFGGLLGLLFASWINEYMSNSLLINNEPGFDIGMDLRVLAFAGATSLLTGLAFGLVPAWLASRVSAAAAMKEGARGSTAGPSHNRIRFGLVVAEIALSLILVATAAAFAIASKNMLHRELGWQPAQVFQTTIALPYNRYPDDIKKREFNRALLEKLQAIPGVEKATICSSLPIFSYFLAEPVVAEGMDDTDPTRTPRSEMSAVSPDFFSLLRIPLKEGSFFNPNLAPEGPAVAVINESLAKRLWPNGSALGKRFRIGDAKELTEVIGVVGNVRMAAGLSLPASPYQLYRPLTRHPHNYIAVALKGSASPEKLTTSVRRAVYEIDQDLTLLFPASIEDFMAQVFSNLDILVLNLAAYACMALLISGIGIYGVISHLTAQRTRDIGVRMALGAQQGEIMRMVLRQGFKLLAIGLILGVIGTSLLMKVLDANLTGFDLPGPWLQALTVLLLAAVTLLACYLPARRASLIDPVIALRAD